MSEHRMLLISTGGTIAGEVATSKKGDEEIVKASAFSDLIRDTIIYLKNNNDVELVIEAHEFDEVDSSDIMPHHWSGLIKLIQDEYDNYDSFVITHGTNTLGYTCAALSFGIVNPGKPIILTGSQVPIQQPGSDAKMNLDNAIRLATWKPNRNNPHPIQGVMAVFGSHIITGTRVKKDTEFDYDAFKSFHVDSIGRIGRIVDINNDNLERHNSYHKSAAYPIAESKEQLKIENYFQTNIASLNEFPGMDYPKLLQRLHEESEVRGFIVRAFGAGDMSTESLEALRYLKSQKVPVVVTTQAPNGNANLQVNEPGQKLAEEQLVIPAYNMSIESQTTKLMWLLAKMDRGIIDFDQLKQSMITNVRGEINIIWEI